jgi:high-affinity K+ transport system ATPase subunit B
MPGTATQQARQPKKPLALTKEMYRHALVEAMKKLHPRLMVRNPVMFVVEVGSVLTMALWITRCWRGEAAVVHRGDFRVLVHVIFANFAEALAEGRERLRPKPSAGRQDTVQAPGEAGMISHVNFHQPQWGRRCFLVAEISSRPTGGD